MEHHPWGPFVPEGATRLFMGTFPPGQHRWAMEFFYPNPINDFWRIMGLVYDGDPDRYYDRARRQWRLPDIQAMLRQRRIAMADTAVAVERLRDNASDKYLRILEPFPLPDFLARLPSIRAVATTGALAANVVAQQTGIPVPAMGQCAVTGPEGPAPQGVSLWRLPSTSRAYPLPLAQKAAHYRRFLACETSEGVTS